MFYVGQKVVCVDAATRKDALRPKPTMLVKGQVYTISGLTKLGDEESVTLYEFAQVPFGKKGWLRRRFRPAVEKKTDISIFKKMLTPKRQERVE